MKKLTVVSFDIIRVNEPSTPYSIASLLSYLKSREEIKQFYAIENISINLFSDTEFMPNWDNFQELVNSTHIAIGCNVWSQRQCLSLMNWVKRYNPNMILIAGGYSVSDDYDDNKSRYPLADYFIHGAGEEALAEVLIGENPIRQYNNIKTKDFELPLIYSNKTIKPAKGMKLRWETKRNCPFNCSFCSYQSGKGRKLQTQSYQNLKLEWDAIVGYQPERINITDPVFNIPGKYLESLKVMMENPYQTNINMQIRPEFLVDDFEKNRIELFELASFQKIQFELGIQTLQEEEMKIIKRENDVQKIGKAFQLLKHYEIPFGVSLIYGLPGQTLDSFMETVKRIQDFGVSELVAYPLMLLPGTPLYASKDLLGLKETAMGIYGLSYVTQSLSFSRSEYDKMEAFASDLNPHYRLF